MSPESDHGQDLFRLTYLSRAVLPVLARFDAATEEILQVARDNNRKLDVSAFLVAHRGWFIQTLEGPRRAVSMLFAAVGHDPRHAQVELLGCGRVERRMFDQGMGMSVGAPAAVLETLGLGSDCDLFKIDETAALALMAALADAAQSKNARP